MQDLTRPIAQRCCFYSKKQALVVDVFSVPRCNSPVEFRRVSFIIKGRSLVAETWKRHSTSTALAL
jgi:hypothetical protein